MKVKSVETLKRHRAEFILPYRRIDSARAGKLSEAGVIVRLADSNRRYSRMNSALRNAGFSLVEILCAVLILGVALTGMIQGMTTALGSSKESELQTVAALFAAGQMETLRAEGGLSDGTKDGECGEGLSQYHWQQTISPAGIDGLHEVTVAVENSRSGKTIYELKTFLFEMPDDSHSSSTSNKRDSDSQRRKNRTR